jgi:hypothetical protein
MDTLSYEILAIIAQESLEVYWKLALAYLIFGLRARKNRNFWLLHFHVHSRVVKNYIIGEKIFTENKFITDDRRFKSKYCGKKLFIIDIKKKINDVDECHHVLMSYHFNKEHGTLICINLFYQKSKEVWPISRNITIKGENITEIREIREGNYLHNYRGAAVVKLDNGKIVGKEYHLDGDKYDLCACDNGNCDDSCVRGDDDYLHVYNDCMRWNTRLISMPEKTILEDLKAITFIPRTIDEWIAKSWN